MRITSSGVTMFFINKANPSSVVEYFSNTHRTRFIHSNEHSHLMQHDPMTNYTISMCFNEAGTGVNVNNASVQLPPLLILLSTFLSGAWTDLFAQPVFWEYQSWWWIGFPRCILSITQYSYSLLVNNHTIPKQGDRTADLQYVIVAKMLCLYFDPWQLYSINMHR